MPATEAGVSAGLLHVLLPEGVELVGARADGRSAFPAVHREGERPITTEGYELAAGERVRFSFTYRLPVRVLGRSGYRAVFALFPRAAVRPDRFRLNFVAPQGRLARERGGQRRKRPVLIYDGVLEGPFSFGVRLAAGRG